jgi:hypothetical protein
VQPRADATAARSQPRALAAGRAIARGADQRPWVAAAVFGALGWASNVTIPANLPADLTIFVRAGDEIWRGHLAAAMADPTVQAGPATLAALSGVDWLGRLIGHEAVVASLVMALVSSACLTLAVRFRQVAASRALSGAGLLAALGLACVWGLLTGFWAHPTHAVIPLLWLVSVREAQRRSPVPAGLALGLALALDAWAAFGLCALLVLLPDVRALARSSAVAATAAAVVWIPFLLAGAGSGLMTWPAQTGSLPSLAGVVQVGSGYRLIQLGIVLAVGIAVVLPLRRDPDLAWLLPVVLVAARIVTDGIFLDYYSFPVRAGLLVGVAALLARRDRRAAVIAVAAWLSSIDLGTHSLVFAHTPLIAGVVMATVVMLRGRERKTEDPPSAQPEARAIAASASE